MIVELVDFSRSSFVDCGIASDRVVVSARTNDGEVNDFDCVIVNRRRSKEKENDKTLKHASLA